MKEIILSIFILSISLNVFSQKTDSLEVILENEENVLTKELSSGDNDSTKIEFRHKTITIVKDDKGETKISVKKSNNIGDLEELDELDDLEDLDTDLEWNDDDNFKGNFKGSWAAVELGINNYFNSDFSISRDATDEFMDLNTGKSWTFNINFAQYSINLINEQFGIVTGLGFEFNNYRFDNDITIQKVDGIIVEDATSYVDVNISKTKLATTYFTVPILFELHIPVRNDEFRIVTGVIGGVKIGSRTKVVYKDDGDKEKTKKRDDFNLSPFRYGLTARLGFEDVNLFANYYMTTLFEKDKGPELYPFSVGISIPF
jgi:hypothetical protein